jgi:hypothetical protein
VAAMPSVGRIKQLSVLGVATAAVLGFSASSASADDVWLWACHSPSNAQVPLPTNGHYSANTSYDGSTALYGDGCATPANSAGFGGGGGSFTVTPTAGSVRGLSDATATFDTPSGLALAKVKISRLTSGFTGSAAQANPLVYEAKAGSTSLEKVQSGDADVAGEVEKAVTGASGDQVKLGISCASSGASTPCAVPGNAPSLNVSRLGMQVTEVGDAKPKFAVGGVRNPAAGTLELDVRATDSGIGLKDAVAYFDGQPIPARTPFPGGTNCTELTPGDATVDLPLDADCPKVTSPNGLSLKVDAGSLPNNDQILVVRVWDWAGNMTEQSQVLTILNNPDLGTATRQLSIGTAGINAGTTPNGANNNNGGVAGATATSCRSPRLSMVLAEKPLRVKKGVPVLKYNKRYKFTGRLTCVINNKRRSAPKRTRVDILSTIGKKTTEGPGTTTSTSGKISVILAYTKSRTLVFRFTNADGQRSQVRIKVTVAKK